MFFHRRPVRSLRSLSESRQPFATPTHVCTFPHTSTFKIEVQSFLSVFSARTQVNNMSSRVRVTLY